MALLVTTAGVPPVRADQPKFYNVELIVFQNLDPGVMGTEVWPTRPKLPSPMRFLALNSLLSGANRSMGRPYRSYRALRSGSLQLSQATRILEKSPHYRVLLHTGWRQPAADEKDALPVWIELTVPPGGSDSAPPPVKPPESAARPGSTSAANVSAAPGTGSIPDEEPRLAGTVKFYVSRYMHFAVHLDYMTSRPATAEDEAATSTTPETLPAALGQTSTNIDNSSVVAPDASTDTSPVSGRIPVVFRLDEERRVRNGELHYFDHPGFGVLVQVTSHSEHN